MNLFLCLLPASPAAYKCNVVKFRNISFYCLQESVSISFSFPIHSDISIRRRYSLITRNVSSKKKKFDFSLDFILFFLVFFITMFILPSLILFFFCLYNDVFMRYVFIPFNGFFSLSNISVVKVSVKFNPRNETHHFFTIHQQFIYFILFFCQGYFKYLIK